MNFVNFEYLTDLEKRRVHFVFQGWRETYLETLKFKIVDDGAMVRDDELRATVYMHVRNGAKKK